MVPLQAVVEAVQDVFTSNGDQDVTLQTGNSTNRIDYDY